jgi:NADH:ubiquinone oxidoreductase subunit 6 (subunit J)
MIEFIFMFFAITAILGAFFILFTKNIVHAAFALLAIFLSIAAIFVLAGSEFLAVTQILVYAGGILILLVFGVLITGKPAPNFKIKRAGHQFWGTVLGLGFFVLLVQVIGRVNFSILRWVQGSELAVGPGTVSKTGVLLMSDYVLPLELAGIILLIALIGAALIAGETEKEGPNA